MGQLSDEEYLELVRTPGCKWSPEQACAVLTKLSQDKNALRKLLGSAKKYCGGNKADAEDAVAEGLKRALEEYRTFDPGRVSSLSRNPPLIAWIIRIIINAQIDGLRKAKLQQKVLVLQPDWPGTPEPEDPQRDAGRAEEREHVRYLLSTLSEKQRAVVWKYYFEDKTDREIGIELEISEAAAKRRRDYALHRLREQMHDDPRLAAWFAERMRESKFSGE
jgi:RNA polymerase sigma factor (sigma-70 family)